MSLTYKNHHSSLNVDLILVSYLLSETRGKWHAFFDDVVDLVPVGTLFLFTDPTAWQMHSFRERYEFFSNDKNGSTTNGGVDCHGEKQRRMNFVWLDSSIYRPEMQKLEGRNGPAVLLGATVVSRERGGVQLESHKG